MSRTDTQQRAGSVSENRHSLISNARRCAEIELRAEEIGDPVQRLRYLRDATTMARYPQFRGSRVLLVVVLAALAGLTHDVTRRERVSSPSATPLPHVRSNAPERRDEAVEDPSIVPDVWLVERTTDFEVYSNGLRIEREFEIANQARAYVPIRRGAATSEGTVQSTPAGIVFHITESDQVPFEHNQNHNLNRIGRDLLSYVRGKRAYHFLIDRFGRVFRVVADSDAANHAGYSVWADKDWIYLNLNESFLGVAFEAHTERADVPINDAQRYAAKVLVEMLRTRFQISAQNCVTHAQVSVNPSSMRIGWHTDWGTAFPYNELGLPDNYECPCPAICLFGFEYDSTYRQATGPALWRGLAISEEQVRNAAAEQGISPGAYRKHLQEKYRRFSATLRRAG